MNNDDKEKYRLSSFGPVVVFCVFTAVLWQ